MPEVPPHTLHEHPRARQIKRRKPHLQAWSVIRREVDRDAVFGVAARAGEVGDGLRGGHPRGRRPIEVGG